MHEKFGTLTNFLSFKVSARGLDTKARPHDTTIKVNIMHSYTIMEIMLRNSLKQLKHSDLSSFQ